VYSKIICVLGAHLFLQNLKPTPVSKLCRHTPVFTISKRVSLLFPNGPALSTRIWRRHLLVLFLELSLTMLSVPLVPSSTSFTLRNTHHIRPPQYSVSKMLSLVSTSTKMSLSRKIYENISRYQRFMPWNTMQHPLSHAAQLMGSTLSSQSNFI
jgi:hypothetical protein